MRRTLPLTQRQNEAFECLRRYVQAWGMPPTLAELGDDLGIRSPNAVSKLLNRLEEKGYIKREPHVARGISLLVDDPLAPGATSTSLPVIGHLHGDSAGALRDHARRHLVLDSALLRNADADACLILLADDDGLSTDGIFKGDLLVVEENGIAPYHDQEVVGAFIDGRAVARRIIPNGRAFTLRPSNRHYSDRAFGYDDEECRLVGPLIGVLRRV